MSPNGTFATSHAANVVAREYRFGGGSRGNVPAKALKTLPTPITGVDDSGVGNLILAQPS